MKNIGRPMKTDVLVQRYQQGDKDSLKVLIKEFHPRLEQQVFVQTRDQDSLQDVVQEAWYAIISNLETVQLTISFDVWALSIARRKGIDWVRQQQRLRKKVLAIQNEELVEMVPAEEDLDTLLERKARLRMAIKELPRTQRIVLTMFYLENYSVKEISEILRVSQGTVKSRLFTAREHLKHILK